MATVRKKTKKQLREQYKRIKSRLNDLDGTQYMEYDTPANQYGMDLENSMTRRLYKKHRIKDVTGKAAHRLDIQAIRSARSERLRLNDMADAAYKNMMKSLSQG